jgi:hypothetical protein
MDRKFLLEVTKGYLTNHNVYFDYPKQIEKISETIYNDLVETIDLVYAIDDDLYEEFRHMKKTDQYRIFEIYLDSSYKSNNSDDNLNESIIGTLGGWVSTFLGSIWGVVAGLPLWANGGLIILVLSIIGLKREPITRKTFQFLSEIGKVFDKVGDILKKGRFTKFRYAVLQQNVESCYKECGITNLKKDISWSDYFNKYAGDTPGTLLNNQNKAQCLINCYLNYEIKKVKLVTKMYFTCLRNTQNFDNIKGLSSQKLLNILMTDTKHRKYNFGMQTACAEYFNIISESIQKIHDLIEFFYQNKTTQQELIMTLQKDIDQVKQDVLRMNQQQLNQYK